MRTVYGQWISGNCYKIRLMLSHLGLPYQWQEVDVIGAETRQPPFLALNPNGRVPVLQEDSGRCLAESNAILLYLAEGTAYVPEDAWERALMYQWLFFEQYSHEPYIATSRYLLHMLGGGPEREPEVARRREGGKAALTVMEQHLNQQPFFVAGRYTLADLALYAYTHVAPEGGFPLEPYPAVCDWLHRVREQPGHVPMDGPLPPAV